MFICLNLNIKRDIRISKNYIKSIKSHAYIYIYIYIYILVEWASIVSVLIISDIKIPKALELAYPYP